MRLLQRQKLILLLVLAVSVVFPLMFVQFDEPSTRLNAYKLLAKTGALCGGMLMFWQVLLGFRGAVSRFVPDLIWVLGLHRKIGTYLPLLIVLHPVFITLYYLDKYDWNLFSLNISLSFDVFVLIGIVSLALLVVIIISSLFRPSFRSYSTWYFLHLGSYILLLLMFIHSIPIGSTIGLTRLGQFWWLLAGILALVTLFRIATRLGLFVKRHLVSDVRQVGPGVTRITMQPVGGKMEPITGQFIFLRWGFWGNARPFTVSHYDRLTGKLSVTVKALGKTTTLLQGIQKGETVYLEGPFGVFTHAALEHDRPVVMIAGGIGITPFTRLFDELAYEPGRELHLFYGNKYTHEIVYKDEIEGMKHVNVIHVLSHEDDYAGEKGFITVDLLKKYLPRDLKEYEFLICGPPVMTEKIKTELTGDHVPAGQIHYELFSY